MAASTCMVSIGIEVPAVKARVRVVLIESLSLTQVDPRVVFPQPIAILHLCLPGQVHQLWDRLTQQLCLAVSII